MTRLRAPRLKRADYIGRRSYLLTICTYQRLPLLTTTSFAESLLMQFRRSCQARDIAIHAFAFMPDHVHFLVEGRSCTSDALDLTRDWKSRTAFHFRRTTRRRLWHRSFYDRVMRDRDEVAALAIYVVDNPARAGLPAGRCDYPFVGSDTMTIEEIRRRKLASHR